MSSGVATKVDRYWVIRGMWLGPLLLLLGYYGMTGIWQWLDAKFTLQSVALLMAGIVVFPTAVLLAAAAVAAMRHERAGRWIFMAVGAALSLVAIAAVVTAATGILALAIS
jgi:hypothetical protein